MDCVLFMCHQEPSFNTCVIAPVVCCGWFSCGIQLLACCCPTVGFFFFKPLCSLRNLSYPIRHWTWALGSERAGSWPLDCQGIPSKVFSCLALSLPLPVPPGGGVHSVRTGPGPPEGSACLRPRLAISGSFFHVKQLLLPSLSFNFKDNAYMWQKNWEVEGKIKSL